MILYKRNVYCPFTYIKLQLNGCYFNLCNNEGMTSFPHSLVLDLQPRFGLTKSESLNLNNFLINLLIFMKIAAQCSAFVSLSYKVHGKICIPIPLKGKSGIGRI